jgi:hypothetical protein
VTEVGEVDLKQLLEALTTAWEKTLEAELSKAVASLKDHLDDKLALKANADAVDKLETRVTAQERGEFTQAQTNQIVKLVDEDVSGRLRNTWALRTNKLAVLFSIVAVVGCVTGVLNLLLSH